MLRLTLALVLIPFSVPVVSAQQISGGSALTIPRFDVSLGYNFIRANAPPAGCNCFDLNGGYLSAGFHITSLLGIAAEVTGGHAGNVSTLGQDLTLTTFTAGPRISLTRHKLVPFAQALFGGAHGSNSYFPSGTTSSPSATNFAFNAGGGLDVSLTRRFAIRAVDAEYLRTSFPNGTTSNWQSHFMIGAGLVVKFGGESRVAAAPVAITKNRQIDLP
jgi:opacity protein-like surface antigen